MLYGYGEDALTLYLLGAHTRAFVASLENSADGAEPTVFYRPTFGRRATAHDSAGEVVGSTRAEFGEFDAIVATSAGTYLVEVKWPGSGVVTRDRLLALDDRQAHRHVVMRCYIEAWRSGIAGTWPTWEAFVAHSGIAARLPTGVKVPGDDQRVTETLLAILSRLAHTGPVRDVVLFAATPDARREPPTAVHPATFALVVADLRSTSFGPLVPLGPTAGVTEAVAFRRVAAGAVADAGASASLQSPTLPPGEHA